MQYLKYHLKPFLPGGGRQCRRPGPARASQTRGPTPAGDQEVWYLQFIGHSCDLPDGFPDCSSTRTHAMTATFLISQKLEAGAHLPGLCAAKHGADVQAGQVSVVVAVQVAQEHLHNVTCNVGFADSVQPKSMHELPSMLHPTLGRRRQQQVAGRLLTYCPALRQHPECPSRARVAVAFMM